MFSQYAADCMGCGLIMPFVLRRSSPSPDARRLGNFGGHEAGPRQDVPYERSRAGTRFSLDRSPATKERSYLRLISKLWFVICPT